VRCAGATPVTECSMVYRVHIAAEDVLASTGTDLHSKSLRRGVKQRQPSNWKMNAGGRCDCTVGTTCMHAKMQTHLSV